MKLNLTIVILALLLPISFTNLQAQEKINIFIMRGLIRENAHSQFFFDNVKKKFPHINFLGLEVKGNGALYKEESPLSVDEMVDDLKLRYAEYFKDENTKNYLVAISLGGMVAVNWLSRHPKDFKKAIVLNSSLKGFCGLTERLLIKNFGNYLKFIFTSDPLEKEKIIFSMIINEQERHKSLIQKWSEIRKLRPVSLKNTLRQIWAGKSYQPPTVPPQIPIIIGVGLGDNFVSPECSKNIAKKWDLPLVTHPTGGHDITNDQPEWVIELIQEHLL